MLSGTRTAETRIGAATVVRTPVNEAPVFAQMSLSAFGRLLSILAIVGLAVAPITRQAMALPNGNMAMVDDGATGMPEDMPCCPKKAPIPDCGKTCPLMAICATQLLCNAVQGLGLAIPLGLAGFVFPANDSHLAGLSQAPPPRPPNT